MRNDLPDLESAIAAINLCDYQTVDWARVQRSAYIIHQLLHYEYTGPIHDLRQRLMLLPSQQHGDQRLLDYRLTVTNPIVETVYHTDTFGNTEIRLAVPLVEQAIDFEVWILIERQAGTTPHYLPASVLANEHYIKPSPLTQPDQSLYEIADQFKSSGKQGLELAQQINTWVYETMEYAHDVTSIWTTAAEALALRQGVCQDYAHIMVTLCRLCALPARYVSGHLLGEGGTHAWVEVLLPIAENPERALVEPLDPTHGRSAGISYVTVAVGNDYSDVAPTSGTYRATHAGQLSARKRVGLTMYEYASTR